MKTITSRHCVYALKTSVIQLGPWDSFYFWGLWAQTPVWQRSNLCQKKLLRGLPHAVLEGDMTCGGRHRAYFKILVPIQSLKCTVSLNSLSGKCRAGRNKDA